MTILLLGNNFCLNHILCVGLISFFANVKSENLSDKGLLSKMAEIILKQWHHYNYICLSFIYLFQQSYAFIILSSVLLVASFNNLSYTLQLNSNDLSV